jgi:hypothetical protein
MTTALATQAQTALGVRLLQHFQTQLASAQTLLGHVLEQGRAIRAREVEGVLAHLAAIQGEMERRATLERDRAALLLEAAGRLNVPAHTVTLDAMSALLAPAEADAAREASAQLRGLLDEVSREHQLNRALMKQELAFLDHLTRLLGGGAPEGGYQRPGTVPTGTAGAAPFAPALAPRPGIPAQLRALDLEA